MKELQDQYSALCQRLGDAFYKKSILDTEISELQAQLKSLNMLNSMLLAAKKPEDALKQFIEKRKKETGATDIQVSDGMPE